MGGVEGDLSFEGFEGIHFHFVAQTLDEADFHALAVEVAGMIEEVDFELTLGDTVVLNSRAETEIGDAGKTLAVDGGFDRIDPDGGKLFGFQSEVGGGEAQLPGQLAALDDGAVDGVVAAEEAGGGGEVTTLDGDSLYQHEVRGGQSLVPGYVAAGITDLLQTAVNIGTGKAAQIGRPVAGKTGTTSSNKDGWFLGFSSGITTGVWMGRDDARAVPGLQGGTAPARAFADFMRVAVANRPIQKFETDVPLPDWQLEPDEESWGLP